ncbi:glycosyltransferase family 4 protein [Vibrio europaeus]|uniref:glycosyltransferase family 4 protein n=1 Tax=Vibrio europaeus TaxID=300876 RepID=UPI002340C9B8|nr:glycosyltransferase family 4 protein [Vibrio europaeus]MDC5850448.1 glycosyltransferase family 4 protein [Vibrio europaeus]
MKLLFAIKQLSGAVGGAERVLCMVCNGLVAKGHEIVLYSCDAPNSESFYELDSRVKWVRLNLGEPSKPASFFQTLKRMFFLRKAVSVESPDVVIGFMHSMFVPLSLCLIGKRIPVIGSEHIVPEHYKTRLGQYFLFLLSTPFLSQITVLSESIKKRYLSVIRNKMVVMPNPVKQPNRVSTTAVLAPNRLLTVGRLEEQKDHKTLIQAFSLIAERFPDWHLKIVGEGALENDIRKLINDLEVNERVVLSGFTSNIDLEYREADIFVIPSRYEALGLVTAEAMSHGLPSVGFIDCPGTNEIIEHRVTGILVEPESDRAKALADEMQSLMSNESLRKQLGQKAKLNIQGKYSLSVIAKKWEKLLLSNCKSGNV